MAIRFLDLPDSVATEAAAASLAPYLRAGDCVALTGDLGAGKTCFARGLLRALGVRGDVPSPTFTLVQHYDTPTLPVAHFDLYRLKQPDDVFELGWEDALQQGLALVEWPDHAGAHLPAQPLTVTLAVTGDTRRCTIAGQGVWSERLKDWVS
ncbi:MAG: tRNA (adenosine(37)-N6)-threonylcarbamoyltransferase complex ATPase subunit type 1 TsaE [Alphaproteobacteria bacterium]|nr:tRNA (adenosine(37)-N6)-threonylcarbamoyltransferase complex ATPase subunit type 1 TsaE [Alphaproteobacteria bacterium]MBV8548736.1 tRNA (adenosine(37)-N6)-threonylcarbamoyltransferase complex ATPase subunit type 1 TsaE [Alphaproteobacteria bacterium]